ncbi:DUF4013 domain-containing protein [Natrinema salsiterrestre]|uniref:DUF4013 domain-containing protein n=1 Tax=Natrinema salsiterrestre TaxID=2950540 RepID=A0A9Q4Q2R9_9EURY|nr:DUF4013 domain-containing protein [Natrinema salsiterrestre]MDF9746791.1 DUF4013 domain-containing protein [Natrinema salsiterrestre]
MPYCHDCDEGFEGGTILCPDCGSKLAADRSDAEPRSEWSSADSANADGSAGWSSTDSTGGDTTSSIHEDPVSAATDADDQSRPKRHDRDLLEFSFKFPLGKDGKPLLIDSVLVFFGSFLLIPLIFALGYAYRVGRAAARGDEVPPSFDDWGGLGRDGLLLGGLLLGITVAFSAAIGALVLAIIAVSDTPSLVIAIAGLGFLLSLAGSYLTGAIVPVVIGTGSVRKVFSDGRILEFALSMHYLKGVLAYIAFSVVLSIVVNIVWFVLMITVFGIVLIVPLAFVLVAYQLNLLFAMWGHIYNEAAAAGDVEPVSPDASLGFE